MLASIRLLKLFITVWILLEGHLLVHHNNILHTYIDPSHILLSDKYPVCLSGLTSLICVASDPNSGLCNDFPNHNYAIHPPEYFELTDERIYAGVYDIWCLGVSMFYVLYGHFPFNCDQLTQYEQLTKRSPSTTEEATNGNAMSNDYVDLVQYPEISDELKDLFHQIFRPFSYNRISIEDILVSSVVPSRRF